MKKNSTSPASGFASSPDSSSGFASSPAVPAPPKVAIVTGAGQGIGFEIARQLITQNIRVLLNDSDATLAKSAATRLDHPAGQTQQPGQHPGPRCLPFPGDAGDPLFIKEMVDTAVQTFGSLDIVVANAGLTVFGDFFDYTPESFQKVMNVNLRGTFFLAQAAAAQIRRQATGGAIVFTSSVTGHQAHRHLTAYGMSKAAIEMLARSLVVELSPYKITVNAVAPGATLTERTATDPTYKETWSRLTPMGRPASPEDIAAAVIFLTGPGARHITGQTIIVDGGWTAVSPGPDTP